MRRTRPRGFTFVELTVAVAIFSSFVLLVWAEMRHLSDASARAARGSAELLTTMRFVEQFRDDARRRPVRAVGGDGVEFHDGTHLIIYRVNNGRLERLVKSDENSIGPPVDLLIGPRVKSVKFASDIKNREIVYATWECLPEALSELNDGIPDSPRTLILDTACRKEVVEARD